MIYNNRLDTDRAKNARRVSRNVLGDCVAENRGADFVQRRDYIMVMELVHCISYNFG